MHITPNAINGLAVSRGQEAERLSGLITEFIQGKEELVRLRGIKAIAEEKAQEKARYEEAARTEIMMGAVLTRIRLDSPCVTQASLPSYAI